MPMRKRESGAPYVGVDDLYRRRQPLQAAPEPNTTQRLSAAINREHAAGDAGRGLRSESGRAKVSTTTPLLLAAGAIVLGGNALLGGGDNSASTERTLAPEAKVGQVYAEPVDTARASIAAGASELVKKARLDSLGIDEHTRAVGKDGFVEPGLMPTAETLATDAQQREANNEGPRDIPPELLAAQVDYWGGAPASEAAIQTARQQERFNGQP